MKVQKAELKQTPTGRTVLTLILDCPPSEYSEVVAKINEGMTYDMKLSPRRNGKTIDQNSAIWGKIGEIGDALYASKEEIYEECLRRYGQGLAIRIPKEGIGQLQERFRVVDVKQEREDGTIFVMCYKGLSEMNSAEASRLLEGILSECKEMGLPSEIKNGMDY